MDVVFWLGWLNLWGSWIRDLPHWFTSVAFLWTFNKISPKRSLENLTSDDLRSFKLCFYVSWLPNCWKNCHLPWVVYSVPKKASFGTRKFIEFWNKNCKWNLKFTDRSCQRSTHCLHKMLLSWKPLFCKQLQM